jgi:two-component system chemotaxis response regulator CheB
MDKINVLIVDDSAVVRQVLTEVLKQDPGINVLGASPNPIVAITRMNQKWPDVIVLDVEMPQMDGITFLKKIMAEHPTPVVICSTLTTKGTETTMQALAAGAISVVSKPSLGIKAYLQDSSNELVREVKAAARANLRNVKSAPAQATGPKLDTSAVLASAPTQAMHTTTETIVAIGTSTGGTQALEVVLAGLPRTAPGIVIVQHMPEKFTAAFASRLNSVCQIEVKEGVTGDRVMPGRAIIAPGGKHMLVKRSGAQYQVDVQAGPPVNRHCPSVDVLFRSMSQTVGKNALGVIMTGMGDDGARGLKEMRDAGASTLGQNESSCVVYGMPKEAVKHGAVERELPLESIAQAIMKSAAAHERKVASVI